MLLQKTKILHSLLDCIQIKIFFFQTEYRQANSKSNHITDFSIFREKNGDLENHLFYKFDKVLNSQNFEI